MVFIFSVLLVFFLLLLSYKAVLLFTNTAPAQENVFHFLDGKGGLQSGFTDLEISHLEDVKQVMKIVDYGFYLLLVVLISITIYYRKDKTFLLELLSYAGKVTVIAIVVLGVFSLVFFEAVFSLFHRIFFPQGNWIFAADALLIQTFPLEFFTAISRNIFVATMLLGILMILIGKILKEK